MRKASSTRHVRVPGPAELESALLERSTSHSEDAVSAPRALSAMRRQWIVQIARVPRQAPAHTIVILMRTTIIIIIIMRLVRVKEGVEERVALLVGP